MDKKRVIKNVAFIILVPSIIVGAFYGYKYGKKKYDAWKQKKENKDGN